jgi:hypothetical protein
VQGIDHSDAAEGAGEAYLVNQPNLTRVFPDRGRRASAKGRGGWIELSEAKAGWGGQGCWEVLWGQFFQQHEFEPSTHAPLEGGQLG